MSDKIIYFAAVLANLILIVVALYIATFSYGSDARLALLFAIPPALSLLAILQTGGIEERRLVKQVRKATLRKQLKELEDFLK